MRCSLHRWPFLIALLASAAWFLATPGLSRIVPLDAGEALIFPQPGPIPPNARFLIALETPRGKDVPADPSPSKALLDPETSQLHLLDSSEVRIQLDLEPGPHGLVTATPASELIAGQRYRLMVEGSGSSLDDLRAQVEDRDFEVVGEPDEKAPRWTDPPSIEAARRASRDCMDWWDCDDERELDFSLSVADDNSLMLLWSDAPLDGSKPPLLRYTVLKGPTVSLCCFEPNDRVVRFEVVDVAGNRSKPDPPMLAFGD